MPVFLLRPFISLFVATLVPLPGLSHAAGHVKPPATRPNIVFILADDLGIDGLSCYGSDRFHTPQLDRLASTGVRFTSVYATPVCGPTRAQLMTGQYPFRNGAIDIDRTMRAASPESRPALPAILQRAGYKTGMAGKWKQMRHDLDHWGFDEHLASPTANGHYWQKNWILNHEEITVVAPVYFPEVMSDYALDFIDRHARGSDPFFFYYALTNPHTPIVRTPDSNPDTTDRSQLYADNIAYIDKLVGRIVDKLESLGIRDQTLILFSGDNGSLRSVAGTINGRQLSGGKARMSNGGSHVPLIANWPDGIEGGWVCGDLVDFTDMLPTLTEIAGAPLPADKGPIDGISFASTLTEQRRHSRERVFVQLGHFYYVQNLHWRLDEKGRLTDMRDAPYAETTVPTDANDPAASDARAQLRSILDQLQPESGPTWNDWTGFRNRGPGHPRPD